MEKRSRRRTRDLVTQPASQGLSQNEIGCARIIHDGQERNAPFTGRIQMRKTNPLHCSNPTCIARPVHTDVPEAAVRSGDFARLRTDSVLLASRGMGSVILQSTSAS